MYFTITEHIKDVRGTLSTAPHKRGKELAHMCKVICWPAITVLMASPDFRTLSLWRCTKERSKDYSLSIGARPCAPLVTVSVRHRSRSSRCRTSR